MELVSFVIGVLVGSLITDICITIFVHKKGWR